MKVVNSQTIHFEAQLSKIGSLTVLRLPKETSAQLPSRGLVMVKGAINSADFQTPLEPDGKGSHWMKVNKALLERAKACVGDTVKMVVESIKDWPEPKVPADVQKVLDSDPSAHELWKDITPLARWDWLRWINGTKQAETRQKRIVVMCSKLNAGKRNACCFNRSECTDPEVSNRGVLIGAV